MRTKESCDAERIGRKGRDMPFIYDESEIEWTDDENDPPAPKRSQFEYISPPMFGGASEPVRFSIPALRSPTAPHSVFDRPFNGPTHGYPGQAPYRDHDEHIQQLLAILLPAMRDNGMRRVYCRYDGGHDEGFAQLEYVETHDGKRMDTDAFVRWLSDHQIPDKLRAAKILHGDASMAAGELHEMVHYSLADEWAAMLLGQGYGTGEYSMYGAFTVDLEACTITDDPNAEPARGNIDIDE
jgi:hypothetical protein